MNTENIKTGGMTTEEYVKPEIEVIEMIENEGILAASGDSGRFEDGGGV